MTLLTWWVSQIRQSQSDHSHYLNDIIKLHFFWKMVHIDNVISIICNITLLSLLNRPIQTHSAGFIKIICSDFLCLLQFVKQICVSMWLRCLSVTFNSKFSWKLQTNVCRSPEIIKEEICQICLFKIIWRWRYVKLIYAICADMWLTLSVSMSMTLIYNIHDLKWLVYS